MRSLVSRQHEIVVGRAANAQLRLRPVEILASGMGEFNTHQSTGQISRKL